MTTCNKTDCLWFSRCVVTTERDCYVARDNVTPIPALKSIITVKSADTEGYINEWKCESRAQVVLYLNAMPEPAGFISVQFHETGMLLTGTRSTFIKAARNGTLWDQGVE